MLKANHVIVASLMMIVALLASLVTMLAIKNDPYANLERAAAAGGGMSGSEIVAVPLQVQNGQEVLCVIMKNKVKSLASSDAQEEWNLVVYEMKNRTLLNILAGRRIHYDAVLANFGLEPSQGDSKNPRSLSPKNMGERFKKGEGEGDDK